jgi:hypothetical protein
MAVPSRAAEVVDGFAMGFSISPRAPGWGMDRACGIEEVVVARRRKSRKDERRAGYLDLCRHRSQYREEDG